MPTNATKTIHFARLELLRSMNIPFNIEQYSTLNEKHQMANIAPPNTGYPTIQYLGIGRGGHRNAVGSGSNGLIDILQHGVTDAALFEQIPFVLTPTTNDLSLVDRAKYRIRKLETHGGIDYFAYYLKVIPNASVPPDIRVIQMVDGVIASDDTYVPSPSSLSPTPVDISNTVVNTVSGKHIIIQSKIALPLTADEILAINDAVTTIYGDVRYATISEVAIVAGYDISVTNSLGGISATYDEIQSAQVMCFIGTFVPLQNAPDAVDLSYGLNNSMPLPPTTLP